MGIQASAMAGPGRGVHRSSPCRAIRLWETNIATPCMRGHHHRRTRRAQLQVGRHSLKLGARISGTSGHVGIFSEIAAITSSPTGFTTRTLTAMDGSALEALLVCRWCGSGRQGVPQMNLRQCATALRRTRGVLRRPLRLDFGLRYEYMSPLKDITYANSNLTFSDGVPSIFIGGRAGIPGDCCTPTRRILRRALG